MDPNDKKVKSIMEQALKDLVVPRLDKIEKKLTEHDEKFETIIDAVAETKVEVTVLQEDVSDHGFTLERIETKLSSVTRRQDDFSIKANQLNRRVLKLETKNH